MMINSQNQENLLRILHVVTNMDRGGIETMLMNYYRHIDRNRFQFDFLVHRKNRAAYDDEIESMGGKIYRLPRMNPWSMSYRRELSAFFDMHTEYQIVHSHLNCMSTVILKAAQNNNIPVRIAHSHNINQDKNLTYPLKMFYREYISCYATDLLACSSMAGDWLFQGEKYAIMRNAINVKDYKYSLECRNRIRTEFGLESDNLIIGHVGSFSPQKNHEFLLRVFSEIYKKEESARLLLVGDGPLKNSIEKKAKELGILEYIIFTGVRNDVPALMQAMDVFILPSLYEGLGIVSVEAQAAGLPCVISDAVPKDCIVSNGLVKSLNLCESPQRWAEIILQQACIKREDHSKEVKEYGYDIGTAVLWLEKYYTEAVRKTHKE